MGGTPPEALFAQKSVGNGFLDARGSFFDIFKIPGRSQHRPTAITIFQLFSAKNRTAKAQDPLPIPVI
jgi:hypothetical protein